MRFITATLVAFALTNALSVRLEAQTPTATLVGRITDVSRAAIGGATVQVRNINTGELRTAQTQSEGEYTVSNLAPGMYEVSIEKAGFRRLRESNLELQVDQTARLDGQLELGAVSESIEVKASLPLLNTENASRGTTITTHEITEMPLDGRDFNDLGFLVAGVQPAEQNSKGAPFSVNGSRADGINVILDGFNDENPRDAGSQIRPPLEALQEFKMQTSGYSAEYGRLAGGVINMVLKSGGNQFHGALFEFLRNDKFDSRNFFDAAKSKLRRNQFGATVTGPVVIPKLYNSRERTFFLASWESYRSVTGSSQLNVVPTDLERQGNFSQSLDANGKLIAIKDPLGSGNFPGNIIPAGRLDPIALKVLAYYPLPNRPGQANNFLAAANTPDSWDNFLFKVDYKLTQKDNIAVRVSQRWQTSTDPFSGSNLGSFSSTTDNTQALVGISYTRIFTPTLINEARAGLTRTTNLQLGSNTGNYIAGQLGIPGTTSDTHVAGFPKFTVTNLATLGDNSSAPIQYVVNNYDYNDTLTWIKGKHTLRFGSEILRTQFFQPTNTNFNGTFAFQGKWTNSALADLELGLLTSSSRKIGAAWNYIFQTNYGFFVQDDYKIHPNLTLNLGVRYEILKPPVEKYGQLSSYIPGINKNILAGASTVPNLTSIVSGAGLTGFVGVASDYHLPAALTYANYDNLAPRFGLAWRPFGGNRTVLRGGYGVYYTSNRLNPVRTDLTGAFPFATSQTFNRVTTSPTALTLSNPFPAALTTLQGVNTANGTELNAPSQYLQSWNLTVEREIAFGLVVEAGYTGSKGTHLGRKYDINQTVRTPALIFRPYPGFGEIDYYSYGSDSSYNAGTISLQKRFEHHMFFRVNYTYGKSIDEASGLNYAGAGGFAGAQNSLDLRAERGRSDFDIRHSFSMNFTYEVPFQHNWLIRGWQLAGTGRAYSGQPFTPVMKSTTIDLGEPTRPDRIGEGSLPNPTPNRWFNLAAFTIVPDSAFRFGNSGRNILDGPGSMAFNLALSKRFSIGEHVNAQFRWEAFNFLNHANFKLPNDSVDTAAGGTITSAQPGRVMQLGMRIQF